jgi:lysophospholipase L1-like esterase
LLLSSLFLSCSRDKGAGPSAENDTLRLGTVYHKSAWKDLSDFTEIGQFYVSGGKIISPPGNKGYLKLNWYTGLDEYELSVDFRSLNGQKSIFGLPIGFASVNSTTPDIGQYAYFYESTRQILAHSVHTNTDTVAEKIQLPAYTAGDQMRFSIICKQLAYKLTVFNLTKNTSATYSFSVPYDLKAVTQYFMHNTAQLAIIGQNEGSSYEITDINYTSNQKLGGALAVGTSLTAGFNSSATSYSARWATLIGAQVNAGVGDKSAEVILRLPEIIRLKPKTVYLEIGTNDFDFAAWQINLSVIYNTLTSCGIRVIVLTPPPNNVRSMEPFHNWIVNHYPYIDIYAALKDPVTGNLNSLYAEGSDNIHPNAAGHLKWAQTIMQSPLYKAEPYLNK